MKSIFLWIILFCTLFTISLAGYLLVALGFLLFRVFSIISFRRIIRSSIIGFVAIFCFYFMVANYNNGNNYVNELIFERLEYDEDMGVVGNNRTPEGTDRYFEQFLTSSDIITGINKEEWSRLIENQTIVGAGYKMYLMQFGIFGSVLMLFAYIGIYRNSIDKHFMLKLSILHFAAFLQRAYPFWEAWLFLYYLPSAFSFDTKSYKKSL